MSPSKSTYLISAALLLVLLLPLCLTAQQAPAIGEIHFLGNVAISDAELRVRMDSRAGSVFSERILLQDIDRLLTAYDEHGYPFAEVHVADIIPGEVEGGAVLDLHLEIVEGMQFHIMEITVEGNTLTDTDVILRETRIDEGELFDAEKVADIRRRLERLGFFSRVENAQLYVRDSISGVLLRVQEGNTNRFDGVIGYQPGRDTEESGYLTGLVNLSFRNLFGTGRQFESRWESTTREVSELELHYLEPWLFSLPLSIAAGFFQRQQDSAYVRRSVDGELRLLASNAVQLGAIVQSTSVVPSINSAIPGLLRSSTLTGGLDLRIDTRDDVYNPRSGIFLRNAYSGGNKEFISAEGNLVTDFIQRIEVDASYFQELFARSVMAVSLHGRELNGDELDISDLYRVGGAQSLRGYREEQFAGTRFAWMNTELRYSLGRRTFAFLFFDFGYIHQSSDITRGREEFTAYRNGYGLGGQIETALGIMGVSYALGQGDGFSDGKIHFGLVNAF